MHSWKTMLETLEAVDRPNMGFQADMAHTLAVYTGLQPRAGPYSARRLRLERPRATLEEALKTITKALRPWTIDFHVAQNDGTVFGSGSHDKTGRHCLALDPNGKLDVVHDAGYWLRDENGNLTKAFKHICWDGCMFPNDVMNNQQTWNDILATHDQGAERTRLDEAVS